MNTLLILRTHYVDDVVLDLANKLSNCSGFDFCFAIDAEKYTDNVPTHYRSVKITAGDLERLGLYVCPDWGWRCGDYFLISVQDKYPDYRYFWLMEPDVSINYRNLQDFFSHFNLDLRTDLYACDLRLAANDWFWYPSAKAIYSKNVMRCLYPLIRVSCDLVSQLKMARIKAYREFRNLEANKPSDENIIWPNDESTTATVAAQEGFIYRDLNDNFQCYNDMTFRFGRGFSQEYISSIGYNNLIYHPVLSKKEFTNRIVNEVLYNKSVDVFSIIDKVERIDTETVLHRLFWGLRAFGRLDDISKLKEIYRSINLEFPEYGVNIAHGKPALQSSVSPYSNYQDVSLDAPLGNSERYTKLGL